jgi:ACS family hexuronate transporter-like MFS transporter
MRRMTNYRWYVVGLLFAATTINYIDRQILALLKPLLDKEIGWTNTQYAWVNTFFQGAYAVGLLWFGGYVDRVGAKKGYSVSIIAWSIAALLHAPIYFAIGHTLKDVWPGVRQEWALVPLAFLAFLVARVLLGLGEGGNFPSAVKATAQWFPKKERAFATSVFNSGTNAGAIFAPALVPPLAYSIGWEWTFVLAGIAGFAWLWMWNPGFGSPDEMRAKVNDEEYAHIHSDVPEPESGKMGWREVLVYPQAWSFVVGKFLTDPVWWFFLAWLPDFFKKTRGLDLKGSWYYIVIIYSIITVLSIAGGWFVGYLVKRGWGVSRARKTAMFVFALLVLPMLIVKDVGNWPAVLLIALAGSAHQAWSANLFTTVSDMFPKKAVACLVGIGGMAGSVGSMIFQLFVGAKLDSMGKAGYALIFTVCAFAYLIAWGISHMLAPKYEPVKLREA